MQHAGSDSDQRRVWLPRLAIAASVALVWWWARWSPDGSTIVFGSERLKPTGPLWRIKPDGTGLTKIYEDPAGGYAVGPVWSPDGSQIMFALDPHNNAFQHPDNSIYVVNADGSDPRLVIAGQWYKGIQECGDEMNVRRARPPSCCSRRLQFAAQHLLVRRGGDADSDLWIMDLEGTYIGQVTHEPSEYGVYSWAPAQ